MIKRIFPTLFANKIVNVQPMKSPIGLTYFLKHLYNICTFSKIKNMKTRKKARKIYYKKIKNGTYICFCEGRQLKGCIEGAIFEKIKEISKYPGRAVLYIKNEDKSLSTFADLILHKKIILRQIPSNKFLKGYLFNNLITDSSRYL